MTAPTVRVAAPVTRPAACASAFAPEGPSAEASSSPSGACVLHHRRVLEQVREAGAGRGHHDLLVGIQDLVGRDVPAGLVGARIGDRQQAQRTRDVER